MRVAERIIKAQGSSNLADKPEGLGDVDVIRAVGLTGAKSPIGVSLWRVKYQGDRNEVVRLAQMLTELALKRSWAATEAEALPLVNRVLMHYLDDLCGHCSGRGFKLIPGAPVLSDEMCLDCAGQGRLPMEKATDGAVALLDAMARMEKEVAGAVMRRLATEMEL
jgi:hypothetical protein